MIKILLSIVFILNLYALEKVPNWYLKDNGILYNFGYGDNINQAKKVAIDRLNKENNITVILDDVVIDKNETLDGKDFVRVKYITKSLPIRVKQYLKDLNVTDFNETNIIVNSYLLNTPFIKDINNSFGYIPNMRIDKKYLIVNNKKFFIKNNEFNLFLYEKDNNSLFLDIKKNILVDQNFFITINSNKEGYLNLIQIIDGVDIQVLFSNLLIPKEKEIIFPNFKYSDGLSFNKKTNFYTIAFICDKKRDFSFLNSLMFYDDSKRYNFGKLFDILNNCEYNIVKSFVTDNNISE